MIFEMRTYTFHPGSLPRYLHLAETLGRPVRGNDYGLCHGYWIVDAGHLDQVWHLWSYDSLDERSRLRAELAKNDRWIKDYGGAVLPLLQRQDVRFLRPAAVVRPPAAGGLYDLRIARARPGRAQAWLARLRERESAAGIDSCTAGLWTGEAPQPNEVVQLLTFPDFAARAHHRAAIGEDADHSGALIEAQSVLLRPAAFSPMQ
jgi:hypothetical protein